MTKSAQLTFPFNINFDNYDSLEIGHELTEAGQSGDLTPLHRLKSQFGGVGYNTDVAETALQAGQIEFWCEYVMLARWECIALEQGTLGPWISHLRPMEDTSSCEIGDEMKFQALKFAIEEYLPNLPSRDEFNTGHEPVLYYDHRTILPPHRFSIWCLENFREFPKTADGDRLIGRILYSGNRDMIDLLIKNGVKFSLMHLQCISFKYRPDLYGLVFNNLRPHIDRDHIPISCQYHESPNDADLLSQIARAALCAHYREAESFNDLTEFLRFNPAMMQKIPATVEFFQKVLDGEDITSQHQDQLADWFCHFCFLYDEVDDDVFKALQISQKLLEHFKDRIDLNANVSLDFPCMSRSDRMKLHLRLYTKNEDIPEDERFISDGYIDPEPNDDDDYADWIKVVGHDYFEDFLGSDYQQPESDDSSEDDVYSNEDEETGDYQDARGNYEYSYDEDTADYGENDEYPNDEEREDYIEDTGDYHNGQYQDENHHDIDSGSHGSNFFSSSDGNNGH